MKTLRSSVSIVAWAMILVAVLGCGASQREKTLKAAFITVNATRDGFTTFDKDHQQQIVDAAKSLEEGKAALAAYRVERDKMLAVFDDVYRALTAAVVTEDTGSLTAAQKVVDRLKQAYDDLKKVKTP